MKPSPDLLTNFRSELSQHRPFSQMTATDLDFFIAHSVQRYFEPKEIVISPLHGLVEEVFFIRKGSVSSIAVEAQDEASEAAPGFEFSSGELFPTGAFLARRAVGNVYRATTDTFLLAIKKEHVDALLARSAVFAQFLTQRMQVFLEVSRQALQTRYAAQTLAEHSWETPIKNLVQRSPVSCTATTPLRQALETMHQLKLGCIIAVDQQGAPQGILTRYDLLGKVVLSATSLERPFGDLMVRPVRSLDASATTLDAALLMSRFGIRHIPVTENGALAGVVSERDLFALQRSSIKTVSKSIRLAESVGALANAAVQIRNLAKNLLAQGIQARQLTTLISHLNDLLCVQLIELMARQHQVDLTQVCWIALGSEGRGEQTISTDQDNALIMADDTSEEQKARLKLFAQAVNQGLDDCGFPLCKGGIMAGQDQCFMTLSQWDARFRQWIGRGTPEDLLNASIFFDLRALAGAFSMAERLRKTIAECAKESPLFILHLARNAMQRSPALNWMGGLAPDDQGGIDLKLRGSAIFVEVARIFALAKGLDQVGTRQRFEAAGAAMGVATTEYDSWSAAFEFVQSLRLRVQLEEHLSNDNPNRVQIGSLSEIDQKILKESLRVARSLLQRLGLDYGPR